jgi:dihydropteroate synthase
MMSMGEASPGLATPRIMGILNVTPDSFSDGGDFSRVDAALVHALQMVTEGADIIDIGGESTRPGAQEVSVETELKRVIPVIKALRSQSDVSISIDTSKPEVMAQALEAGANMVNDVTALASPAACKIVARAQVPVCIMHMQGQPLTMQDQPSYDNVVEDVLRFLEDRAKVLQDSGIKPENIIIDPGFGFGKTLEHNFTLLAHLNKFSTLKYPLLVGISRKSMLSMVLGEDKPKDRLAASISAHIIAAQRGADILRVHDVKATNDALKILTYLDKKTFA